MLFLFAECQTYREKSIGKRTRYYQSMLDADSLLKGHDYSELKAFLEFVQSSRADSSFTRRIERMVQEKKFENTFINEYMAWSLHDRDVRRQAAAQQKAEDEKIISAKDAENAHQAAEIASLKAQLAAALNR